eukprot:RCo030598
MAACGVVLAFFLLISIPQARASPCCTIAYLVSPKEAHNLVDSLNRTFVYFNRHHLYPTLLFYDATLLPHLASLKARLTAVLQPAWFQSLMWVEIPWKAPPGIRRQDVMSKFRRWFPNYSLMIEFWFSGILHLNATKSFDYYLRLDTDSMLHSDFPVDPFQLMIRKEY